MAPKPRLGQTPPHISSSTGDKRSPSPEPSIPSKRARLAPELSAQSPASSVSALGHMDDINDNAVNEAGAALTSSSSKRLPALSLRSQSVALVPASLSRTPSSTSSPWPEFQLDDILDFEDAAWEPYKDAVHQAMHTLGYPGPKSRKQLQTICLVLERHLNLFLVLPTGSGKTAIPQAIAALPHDLILEGRSVGGNVIVIVPFVALLEEQAAKSRALGLPTFNWQDRKSVGPVPDNTRILYIQPESFISSEFQKYATLPFLQSPVTYHFAQVSS